MKRNQVKSNALRKRKTFAGIFLKGTAISLLVTGICSAAVFESAKQNAFAQVNQRLSDFNTEAMTYVQKKELLNTSWYNKLDAYLDLQTYYDVILLQDFPVIPLIGEMLVEAQLIPNSHLWEPDNCIALSALVGENNNIVSSSRENLCAVMRFTDREVSEVDPDYGWYTCAPEEIPELYSEYIRLNQEKKHLQDAVEIVIESAYVNKETKTFIPHEYYFEISDFTSDKEQTLVTQTDLTVLNVQAEGYELIDFYQVAPKQEYPYVTNGFFHGIKRSDFEQFSQQLNFENRLQYGRTSGWNDISYTARMYHTGIPVEIDGKSYTFWTYFQIDVWNERTARALRAFVLCFFLFAMLLNLLLSYRKHTRNQAQYLFEDYQRTLTNNLAHDLKTPLTAISGYAENLLHTYETDSSQTHALQAITENVRNTDEIITRTLELNRLNQLTALPKEHINLRELTETLLQKYTAPIAEHQLTISIDGNETVKANRETLTTAIDNLLSNAVRYADENGSIQITMKRPEFHLHRIFMIVNDVPGQVDTKDLLMPFVKGDKSRTDKNSHGLGLSIAKDAAAVNGLPLKISCSEEQFTATLTLC